MIYWKFSLFRRSEYMGCGTLIWHILGAIYKTLRAYDKYRKCWFVDLSLIWRKNTSKIVFGDYTNSYSIVTRWNFQNCEIYLLPDDIQFSSNFHRTRNGSMRLNSRTANNRRFLTISHFNPCTQISKKVKK
jgi:hypothetical protein